MKKWAFSFSRGAADPAGVRELGGKGAGIAEMARLGLPVPPGFALSADLCEHYWTHDQTLPEDLAPQIDAALAWIGKIAGHGFDDARWPLLVSVRASPRVVTPGMIDGVLNIGLNDDSVKALAKKCGSERFAYDCYRRFIADYANAVGAVAHHEFEEALDEFKEKKGAERDAELLARDWRAVVGLFKQIAARGRRGGFPQDPRAQLFGAIEAALGSWMSPRAVLYRELHDVAQDFGAAIIVQMMVFGNMDERCATGAVSTRNPVTGARELHGEYLQNAQGEDLTAGLRTPLPVARALSAATPSLTLELFAELKACAGRLEAHYRDMQDIEFTIERGTLWLLQTRAGKRSAAAALKIAVDLVNEGVIAREDALLRVEPSSLDQLLHPTIDPNARRDVIARGLPASPGAAFGAIVFDPQEAEALGAQGRKVILIRVETSPEDIGGMHAADGVLTARGGMTSHAAVIARGMGKPCVTAAAGLRVDYADQSFSVAGRRFRKGETIAIDGASGEVIAGEVKMRRPELTGEFAVLMSWADSVRRLRVRANAETPADARAARKFGAEGIGLARTEHMFFEGARIVAVREMIMADDAAGRRAALEKLLPMQREDLTELFEIMAGLPVAIRLFDPPLHEFLPHNEAELADVAKAMRADPEKLRKRAQELAEANPMLGFRGVRLAIAFPEIVAMQARAIFEAAIAAAIATGAPAHIEIFAPLVLSRAELDLVKARIDEVATAVEGETGIRPGYRLGAMIELPRAALCAGDIAATAQFLSFGTNDLTQTTLGISRDDAGAFLGEYVAKGVLPADPFVTIDELGVGELVRLGAARARATRSDVELGVCGEHGGDPASIAFFESAGFDYVSCSPFRTPIARLAAAQATLRRRGVRE